MSEFEISYEDGKMIVKHPSGLIVEHTKAQIERIIALSQTQIIELNTGIQTCESYISEMDRTAI